MAHFAFEGVNRLRHMTAVYFEDTVREESGEDTVREERGDVVY